MKGDARKARRKFEKKNTLFKETTHKLTIAGLVVISNKDIPDGVMVVSPKEGDRLAEMVANATANAKIKKAEAENEQATQD